jgi:hypothetical protein
MPYVDVEDVLIEGIGSWQIQADKDLKAIN